VMAARAVNGTTEVTLGFIPTLLSAGLDAFPPTPASPPFSMVGTSSLTVNWLAIGNSSTTIYNAQISATSNFSSVLASSQTANLNAPFSGLN
ncbi:hypothetical protein, partial [Pseudomonas sp. GW460-E13]|uniref:hypothetical protein n=1 Tax=Pseudomonas sp. GW460-E13 TaxID=2070611 RepID=UPI001C46824D